jgi:hypothetical protein
VKLPKLKRAFGIAATCPEARRLVSFGKAYRKNIYGWKAFGDRNSVELGRPVKDGSIVTNGFKM